MDYQKLFEFVSLIQGDPETFREQVVDAFSTVFDFGKCDFWLADSSGDLFMPVSSAGNLFIDKYETEYQSYDLLHPKRLGVRRVLREPVIAMTEVASEAAGEEVERYESFLGRFEFHHQMALYLQHQGNLIGCIAFLRSEDEGAFEEEDAKSLLAISGELSSRLYSNMLLGNTVRRSSAFKQFADTATDGMIVFNQRFQASYFNREALRICEQYCAGMAGGSGGGTSVDRFLVDVLGNAPLTWMAGYQKVLLLPSLRRVRFAVESVRGVYQPAEFVASLKWDESASRGLPAAEPSDKITMAGLSARELEIVGLVSQGLTNKQIAAELSLSTYTVKKYLSSIFSKTGVSNRASLIAQVHKAEK